MIDQSTVIDLAWLQSATLADFKEVLSYAKVDPGKLAQVNAVLSTPEGKAIASEMLNDPDYVPVSKRTLSPEETAQAEADRALADRQAASDVEAEAEAEKTKAAEITPPPPPPVEEKKKIVVDYQVTDEAGNTIGRPTHVEGRTYEEVIEKLKTSHINAVRYAERIKKNRVQSIESRTQQANTLESVKKSQADAQSAVEAAAKEKDPAKLAEAIRAVTKADQEAEHAKAEQYKAGKKVADAWMADHRDDFQPSEANSKIIEEWLVANNLGLSYENLEAAFTANETRLAKPQYRQPVEEVIAPAAPNASAVAPAAPAATTPSITAPAPAAAAPVLPAAPQPSQAVATVTEPTPAASTITEPPARRPGVNGSLPPGSLSAQRPVIQPPPSKEALRSQLAKEINKMSSKEYRHKLKTSAEFRERHEAAGIAVVGQH